MNFDTLDILAATTGAFAAYSLLPVHADFVTEHIVVPLSIFLMVTIKRMFVPTLEPNPDSSPVVRMVYLFIAIAGSAILVLIVLATYFQIDAFRDPTVKNAMFLIGVALLLVATLIDRRHLKLK